MSLVELQIGEDCFDLEVTCDAECTEVYLPNVARRWWGPNRRESDLVTLEYVIREFALDEDLPLNDARVALERKALKEFIELIFSDYDRETA